MAPYSTPCDTDKRTASLLCSFVILHYSVYLPRALIFGLLPCWIMARLDVEKTVSELTLAEKIALTAGEFDPAEVILSIQ